MRQRGVRRPDGSWTMQTVRPEAPFAQFKSQSGDQAENENFFESRMMLVGVGEWTRRQAYMLYELGR